METLKPNMTSESSVEMDMKPTMPQNKDKKQIQEQSETTDE